MTDVDPTTYMVHRKRLADELRRLRERTGASTYDIAARLGWSQSKVSKVERGESGIRPEQAAEFARAAGATPAEVTHIEDLVEQARAEHVTVRQIRRAGGTLATKQREFAALAAGARRQRTFSTQVPGLLQLPDQARLMFSGGDASAEEIAQSVAARLARQQILFDPSYRFEFVLVEQSLRWRSLPTEVHIAQLDRIRTVGTSTNVDLAVVPWTAYAPIWHGHSFTIFSELEDDDYVVSFEPLGAESRVSGASDPERAERFVREFEALQAVAVRDADVRALITQVIEDLRSLDA